MEVSPLGAPVDFSPAKRPEPVALEGARVRLDPLDPERHAAALHAAYAEDEQGAGWTYLPYGPFADAPAFAAWLTPLAGLADPVFHAIFSHRLRTWCGLAAYLRIEPDMGSIEVGHIHFAPSMRHSAEGTEAMFLMMRHAFETLGYRRYEWKCNALNASSMQAAGRLGFTFEGVFRQAAVVKGRNRDTAWFSVIDGEWPALKAGFEAYLSADNFDAEGRRQKPLAFPGRPRG